MGYQLDQIHEVWHFPETSQHLFAEYINTFLKRSVPQMDVEDIIEPTCLQWSHPL
jgi:hypothetical protein